MKFTNGYWMLRDEIEASYAVEYAKHTVNGNKLEVYLPAKHMSGRGDALNIRLQMHTNWHFMRAIHF